MNVTLIGMSGVGKSFIGRKLALRLKYNFIDVDKIIEEKEGEKLQKILDKLGDKKFIELEGNTAMKLNGDKMVIAPGGSIIFHSAAMEYLKRISKIVYLKDKIDNIKKNIGDAKERGIVGLKRKTFDEVYNGRKKLYEKYADFSVNVSNFEEKRIISEIIEDILKN